MPEHCPFSTRTIEQIFYVPKPKVVIHDCLIFSQMVSIIFNYVVNDYLYFILRSQSVYIYSFILKFQIKLIEND